MKDVHHNYRDTINVYVINVEKDRGLGELARLMEDESYPWPLASPSSDMLKDLSVVTQPTKIAFDRFGRIGYRSSSPGDSELWPDVFEDLLEN